MATISQLNTRNQNTNLTHTDNLRALAEGGQRLKKRMQEFLPIRPGETGDRYQLRCAEFTYQNYLGTVCDFTAANLFASKPQPVAKFGSANANPGDWWAKWFANCDGGSTDFDDFMQGRFSEALISGVSWVRLHAPSPNADYQPQNRLEFEQLGYDSVKLEALNVEDVIDWATAGGQLIWALTYKKESPRIGLRAERYVTETWTELTDSEIIQHSLTWDPRFPPSPDQEVPIVSSTTHTWGVVPLVAVTVPSELWLANKLELPCRAHLRLLNGHQYNLLSSSYSTPVFSLKDPNNVPNSLGAGYGVILSDGEDFRWVAPPAAHLTAMQAELASARSEIFRSAFQLHLGLDGTAISAVQRSAESKIADAQSSKVMSGRFAKVVRESMQRVLEFVSGYRGDKFTWSIDGLRDTSPADLYALIDALEKVERMGGVPSNTAKAQLWSQVADGLLQNIPQGTRQRIHQEIAAGVATALSPEDRELALHAKLHALAAGNDHDSADDDQAA